VKVAIEMHPGFLAYSPETLIKLRAVRGHRWDVITIRVMFWQGYRSIAAIRVLGDLIFHVHAK
jgi:sugar phosphate isomerase/epimerase